MKKTILTISLITILFTIIACDSGSNTVYTEADLPLISKTFLSTHFSGQSIKIVEKDSEGYDVFLESNFEIEFDLNGDWLTVDSNHQIVPSSIIALMPSPIVSYIAANHSDTNVSEIDKESYGYKIVLSNDFELNFDKEGVKI